MTEPRRCRLRWCPFALDWIQAAAVFAAIIVGLWYFTARVDEMVDDLTARAAAHWDDESIQARRIEAKLDAIRADLEAERQRP